MKKSISIFTGLLFLVLYQLNAQTFFNYPEGCAYIDAIDVDDAGNIWVGLDFEGLLMFDGEKWTDYTTESDSAYVRTIACDSYGNTWFGTYRNGVIKFDGENWINYDTLDGLAGNEISSIDIDEENNIWVGCYGTYDYDLHEYFGGGVSKFDGEQWTSYDTLDGLASNHITALGIDEENNIWVGCGGDRDDFGEYVGGGILKFDGENWTSYTVDNGLPSNFFAAGKIAFDLEGNIWFSTFYGDAVYKFDGENWIKYSEINGSEILGISIVFCDSEGKIWIGANDYYLIYWGGGFYKYYGAQRFDGNVWTQYTTSDGLAHNEIGAIAEDPDGNIWFGTKSGLSKLVFNKLSISHTSLTLKKAANSTATFTIASDTDWTISGLPSWLAASATSGTGDATITLTAEENTSIETRMDTITISGTEALDHTIIVTQNISTVGISNQEYLDIKIYPDPTNGIFTIDIDNPQSAELEIFNMQGKLVYRKNIQSQQERIDMSAYSKGMYLVKVNEGGTVKVGKVILE